MPHEPDTELGNTPTTPDELHDWLGRVLHLNVPRRAVIDVHASPFEYLCWSFFGVAPGDWGEPADARESLPTDCVVWANRGGGKTFLGAVATALDLLFRPGIQVRVLGGSLEQSRRLHTHLRRLFDPRRFPALAAEVDGRITERRLVLTNGSEVELLAQSQTSVRGTRVQKLRCDEVDLFDPEVWDAVQLTTRSATLTSREGSPYTVRGSVECLSTMHLPYGVMHRLVREAREGQRRLFRWGVVDVLEHCPPRFVCGTEGEPGACPLLPECRGRAKARPPHKSGHVSIADAIALKRRVATPTWEAEMLCRRPKRSDSVFPEFQRVTHVFGEDGRGMDTEGHLRESAPLWVAGMDFGIRGATSVLWGAMDAQGLLWVLDERHLAGVVLSEHVAAMARGLERDGVAAWPRPTWVAIDPAGEAVDGQTGLTAAEVLRRAGLNPVSQPASIPGGIAQVRARLCPASGEGPRLLVHARCTHLIESLERYAYPRHDPYTERPEKGQYDHAADALRYLIRQLDRPRHRTKVRDY